MERNIDKYLVSWKKDLIRKPLVIYGSKQIGKTFTITATTEYGSKSLIVEVIGL